MKKIITLLFLALIIVPVLSQSQNWTQTFGGAGTEHATGVYSPSLVGQPMARIGGENIICGYTDSLGNGGTDMYLISVNDSGLINWTSMFGAGADTNDVANSIFSYDMNFNFNGYAYIVGGSTYNGVDKDATFYYVDSYGATHPGLIYDNGSGDDEIMKMKPIEYYYMYAVGYQTDALNNKDLMVLSYEEEYYRGVNDLIPTGVYTISGPGDDVANDFDGDYNSLCIAGYTTSNTAGDKDIFISYLDLMQYQFRDSIIIGGSGDDEANVISMNSYMGDYIIAGYYTETGASGKDAYIVKVDGYGNIIWSNTFGWDGDDEILAISSSGDMYNSDYIVAGYTYKNGNKDVLIAEIDGDNGDTLWTNIVGENTIDEEATGIINNGCSYIVTGNKGDDIFLSEFNTTRTPLDVIITEPSCYNTESGQLIIGPASPEYFWMNVDYDLLNTNLSYPSVYGTTTNSYGGSSDIWGNISAGTYYITLTDGYTYCESYDTIVISQPEELIYSTNMTLGCYGDTNKVVNLSLSGGVAPYYVEFNFGGYRQQNLRQIQSLDTTFNNLFSGSYVLYVEDANGCMFPGEIENIDVPEPNPFSIYVYPQSTVCFGASDGSLVVEPTGDAPFSYIWDNGQTTEMATNLIVGSYSVTATDNNGCSITDVGEIYEYPSFNISSSVQDANCYGESNGDATIFVTGGTIEIDYGYLWSNGSTLASTSELSAGNYSVTITDDVGCDTTYTLAVSQPDSIVSTASISNISCYGMNNGSIVLSTVGGTPSYSYSWSNGATTQNLSALINGTYGLTITDTHLCQSIQSYTISQPSKINVLPSVTNEICTNSSGAISTSVFGGTSPYNYTWSNGATTGNINGLSAGSYSLTVTDANSCSVDTILNVSSIQTVINLIPAITNETCDNASGAISITAFGGVTPYIYNWTNSSTSAINSGLSAGVYGLTLTDANNCSVDTFFSITNSPNPTLSLINAIDILCYGNATGSVSVMGTGGTAPLNYFWSNGGTGTNQSSLTAGTYAVTAIDAVGCRDTLNTTLIQPEQLVGMILSSSNVSCNGGNNGSISTTISGGVTPYSYIWSNGDATQDISSLSADTYVLTITDANNCIATTSTTVFQPTELILTINSIDISCFGLNDGSVAASVTGGTLPYSYMWTTGDTSSTIEGLEQGVYNVIITDANLCESSTNITISEPEQLVTNISSTTDFCDELNSGTATFEVTGGTLPYNFLWSNGNNTQNLINISGGTYYITATDANNCEVIDTIIVESEPFATIQGALSDGSGALNANATEVRLFTTTVGSDFEIAEVISMNNAANGEYAFANITPGNYYVKAHVIDEVNYSNLLSTYYLNSYKWFNAEQIQVGCDTTINIDITMLEKVTAPTGDGTISGIITYVPASGNKAIMGEPVPGAEITLEQEPDDEPIANVTTEGNGEYIFTHVPDGLFKLSVDVPGLPQFETHTITVSQDDTLFSNMNFIVDTNITLAGVYIEENNSTPVYENESITINLYPNPFVQDIKIEYTLKEETEVNINLFDVNGRLIRNIVDNKVQFSGSYSCTIDGGVDNLTSGIYFIEFKFDNLLYFKKVIKSE